MLPGSSDRVGEGEKAKILWHFTVQGGTQVTLTGRDVPTGKRVRWLDGDAIVDATRGQTLPGKGAGPNGSGSNFPSLVQRGNLQRILVHAQGPGLNDQICVSFR